MEEAFGKIVHQIFNNWAALRLAVEHSLGGPNSKQSAIEFMDYMTKYCLYESNVDVNSIQDALEDIFDEEFETICEDGSTKEIASLLFKFVQLLNQGNTDQCEEEFTKLPVMNVDWLKQNNAQVSQGADDSSSSEEEEPENNDVPMEDDGWTEVKSRRKK